MVKYLKLSEKKKLIKADEEDAEYAIVPIDEYIAVDNWNELLLKHERLEQRYNKLRYAQPETAGDFITIPKALYNGYLNALRIIEDRGLQQIERQTADQHGYTLKYADLRVYDRTYPDQKAFWIVKQTPISLKIDVATASFIIKQSLYKHYNFRDISQISTTIDSSIKMTIHELLIALEQKNDPDFNHEFYVENSTRGRRIKEYIDGCPDSIIFELAKISSNIGQGVYDISYWANNII